MHQKVQCKVLDAVVKSTLPLDSRAVEMRCIPGEWYLSDCIVPSIKFGGGGIVVLGCFSGAGLGTLVPVNGTLNASAYQELLDNFMHQTLLEQFEDGPLLFQHYCAPVHKARSRKTWMKEFGVDELDRPAHSLDLNPTEHLWDE